MKFSSIIGQNATKNQLIRTVAEQRIPHAILIFGKRGIGKLGLALAYAQYISCENRSEDDSCGVCPSCVKYNKLAHPDLHLVFPIIKPANKQSVICDDFVEQFRKRVLSDIYFDVNDWYTDISLDAKQGLIYANESEEIIRKLNLKTFESEYKVMLVWLPEKMNDICANKLLKILEEPPEKTLFLLVSNSPEELLQTILSRTQPLSIPRLSDTEIIEALLIQFKDEINREDALYAARIGNGSYLDARAVLNENDLNKENFNRFSNVMRLAWRVGNKKEYSALRTLRNISDDMATIGREKQKKFLTYAQQMIRESYIFNLKKDELNYLTIDEISFTEKFCPFINEVNIEQLMTELALAERHIEQNVNAKMIFFDLFLKLIVLIKK